MDKKITTKKDVVQLFEAAGFSRSNPYYIVKQGKINEMATQSERDRLELFKEIAGTRVYDDKRAESMKLFKKSEEDRSKIQQGLSHIVDKLESLEQDKEDFTQVRFIVSSPSKSGILSRWAIRENVEMRNNNFSTKNTTKNVALWSIFYSIAIVRRLKISSMS